MSFDPDQPYGAETPTLEDVRALLPAREPSPHHPQEAARLTNRDYTLLLRFREAVAAGAPGEHAALATVLAEVEPLGVSYQVVQAATRGWREQYRWYFKARPEPVSAVDDLARLQAQLLETALLGLVELIAMGEIGVGSRPPGIAELIEAAPPRAELATSNVNAQAGLAPRLLRDAEPGA